MSVNIVVRRAIQGMNSVRTQTAMSAMVDTALGRHVMDNSNHVEENYDTVGNVLMDMARARDVNTLHSARLLNETKTVRGLGRTIGAIAKKEGIPRLERNGGNVYPAAWVTNKLIEMAAEIERVYA